MADLDGDGRRDLAFVSQAGGTVGVAWNEGNGDFAVVDLAGGMARPEALAVLDVNGDGAPDLVVAEAGEDRIRYFANAGARVFAEGEATPVGTSPHALVAADLDGDRDGDLLVSNFRGGSVSVVLNRGGQLEVADELPSEGGAERLAVFDLNGDGAPDLAVPTFMGGVLHLFMNDGTAGFTEARGYFSRKSSAHPVGRGRGRGRGSGPDRHQLGIGRGISADQPARGGYGASGSGLDVGDTVGRGRRRPGWGRDERLWPSPSIPETG